MASSWTNSHRLRLALAAGLLICACDRDAPPERPKSLAKRVQAPPPAAPARREAPVAREGPAALARCSAVEGDVEFRKSGAQTWAALEAEESLGNGDWVRTGLLSYVRLSMSDGTVLEFDESTAVELHPGSINLHTGTVRGTFEATGLELAPLVGAEGASLEIVGEDGSEFKVVSKDGEAATFRVTGDQDGSRVKIESGLATVQLGGEASAVEAGAQLEVAKGRRVSSAKVLEAPKVVEPAADASLVFKEGMSIPLSWKPVGGARDYRVLIARDPTFEHLVLSKRQEGTQLKFEPPRDSMYAWRVVARDARGREGEPGQVRRIYVLPAGARDVAPSAKPKELLLSPDPNAVYEFTDSPPKVLFRWGADPGAARYRWVLADGPDLLNQTVKSEAVNGQKLEFRELPSTGGEFYWGVYAEHDGMVPLFSKPRRLVVKKVRKARFETVKKIDVWGK